MSINLNKLISESEEFIESKFISEVLDDIKGSTKNYYKPNATLNVGATIGMATGLGMMRGGAVVTGAGLYGASALAYGIGSVAYPLYKYMTSYHRLSQKVDNVSALLDQAKKEKNDSKIQRYSNKLNKWKVKLETSKAKLRKQNPVFIMQTNEMKDKLVAMKKQGSDKTAIDTLEKKIGERASFIRKIGGKI